MGITQWFIKPVKEQYADFEGCATRKQFWMFTLYYFVLAFLAGFITGFLSGLGVLPPEVGVVLPYLFMLALLVPSIAISVRRLHDSGRSGWWYLISLIPFIGWIVFIILMVLPSKPGSPYCSAAGVPDAAPQVAPPVPQGGEVQPEVNQQ